MKFLFLLFSIVSLNAQLFTHFSKNQSEASLIGQGYAGSADTDLVISQRINPANPFQTDRIRYGMSYSIKPQAKAFGNSTLHEKTGFNAYVILPSYFGISTGIFIHDYKNFGVEGSSVFTDINDNVTGKVGFEMQLHTRRLVVPVSYSFSDDFTIGLSLIGNDAGYYYRFDKDDTKLSDFEFAYRLGFISNLSENIKIAMTYTPSIFVEAAGKFKPIVHLDHDDDRTPYYISSAPIVFQDFDNHVITLGFSVRMNESSQFLIDLQYDNINEGDYKKTNIIAQNKEFFNYSLGFKTALSEISEMKFGMFSKNSTAPDKDYRQIYGKSYNSEFLTFGYALHFENFSIDFALMTNNYTFSSNDYNITTYHIGINL